MPGHVGQRGDAWELRAYVGRDPVTGRKKYSTRTFKGGKRAADQALIKFVVDVGGGGASSSGQRKDGGIVAVLRTVPAV